MLTSPELLKTIDVLLREHRERLYPPGATLAMFMFMFMRQVLESDDSCQKAVYGWARQCAAAPADILTAALKIRAK